MTVLTRLARLWMDIRRRRVFRTGALYVVIVWALVQAASIAFPAFGMSDLAMRAVLTVAVAGFPVVLILAWTFEIGPAGLEVTEGLDDPVPKARNQWRWLRLLAGTSLIALVMGSTMWLWSARLAGVDRSEFATIEEPEQAPVIAVLSLENLTGRRDLDWAGSGIATLVRDDLARSRHLRVVSASRTSRIAAATDDDAALMDQAKAAGITHLLTGEVLSTPKGFTVSTRVTDLRRNIQVTSGRQQSVAADALLTVSTPIASMVKQGLHLPGNANVDLFAADFASRNAAAYEAFIAGMEHFLRFNYAEARTGFEVAVKKAPDFAMARYRLAHTLAVLGDTQGAQEQIARARKESSLLPDLERRYIDAGESYFSRNYTDAEQRYRQLLEQYPNETEARLLLIYVLYDEAKFADALTHARVLANQEPDSEVAWGAVADLNLRLRRFDDAEPALERYVELAPENPNAYLLFGDSRLLQKRYAEARKYYATALQHDANFGSAQLQQGYADALTGNLPSAMATFRAMAGSADMSDSDRITAAFEWANLLRAVGQCAEATRVLDQVHDEIAQEQIRVPLALALRGYCALDVGDAASARKFAQQALDQSGERRTRYLFLRGLAELEASDLQAAAATIKEIAAQQDAADTDRSSEKAALYLTGLLQLARNQPGTAAESLERAMQANGREYELYRLGYAQALAAAGDNSRALEVASSAAVAPDPMDPRLDLELSRRRAALLQVRLMSLEPKGNSSELARQLTELWSASDPNFRFRSELLGYTGAQPAKRKDQ